MNEHHALCGSEEWRTTIREQVIPWAFGGPWGDGAAGFDDGGLGDDVLEVGPGYGATTDVFREVAAKLTSVEIDHELAVALRERLAGTNVDVIEGDATALTFPDGRFTGAVCFTMLHHVPTAELQDRLFAEVARVVVPGARFVLADSLGSEVLEQFHEGDTYNPVDPDTIPERLTRAGFTDVVVRANDHGWTASARRT
ncbi:class I SAM-dependent methyltransferase [Desertimonas flava]|uniref:class I SAM-dependent methyltransferase n=1 Tax=Desertimonas flava TaxID=2064846 RepID=UPI000E3456B6|nr:class I SAM-dependent methyltransferase [Desertimonas flava]